MLVFLFSSVERTSREPVIRTKNDKQVFYIGLLARRVAPFFSSLIVRNTLFPLSPKHNAGPSFEVNVSLYITTGKMQVCF